MTYDVKKQEGNPQTAVIFIKKNRSETYNICKLLRVLKGRTCKPSRQRVVDKYNTFKATHDMDNLTEWEQGYFMCLQQLMVRLKELEGHDVYKPKEVVDEVLSD